MTDQVEEYVTSAVSGMVANPPDTDFQCGFLARYLLSRRRRWGCTWTILRLLKHKSCGGATSLLATRIAHEPQ
jgi:hypothetical protein